MKNKLTSSDFFNRTINLLQSARQQVVQHVNLIMVHTYFEIGRMIVEEEQGGENRAEYGKGLLKELSKVLTQEFGKGFSVRNIEQMRKFYSVFSNSKTLSANSVELISETASKMPEFKIDKVTFKLSWSHYITLMRIEDKNERSFYEIEAIKNNWSIRELKRQYNSALYSRLTLSRDKKQVKQLSEKGLVIENAKDAIKDPYVLEFIGLPEQVSYSENDLEQAIINKLKLFLLDLGTGFTFVARQKGISFEGKHFYIDLVFFNRILNCFVLIDLKNWRTKTPRFRTITNVCKLL